MYYNKVTLVGRLTKDPMVQEFEKNKKRAFFTLAIDRGYPDTKGKKIKDFISIICWHKLADVCEELLKKGNLILVDGKIHTREYKKDGESQYVTEIVADRIKFLNPKPEEKNENTSDLPRTENDY